MRCALDSSAVIHNRDPRKVRFTEIMMLSRRATLTNILCTICGELVRREPI